MSDADVVAGSETVDVVGVSADAVVVGIFDVVIATGIVIGENDDEDEDAEGDENVDTESDEVIDGVKIPLGIERDDAAGNVVVAELKLFLN